uniref:RNA-dependent RNA polymerase n=1 Tax=Lentinula edodes partitivirus 3 TaxID=2491352 RepID=A0A7S6Z310_9VIRU|nr:RNA-dependent RNA polymerase [Lentinula edodes partitivirus 3]
MNSLIQQLSDLSLNWPSQNLAFVGIDPFHGSAQPFKMDPNDWAFHLQIFVASVICLYAFLFPVNVVQLALHGFRRSQVSGPKAEQFFFRYDVPRHDIVKDKYYYEAIRIVCNWFRPKWKIHPVHFTDLRWYPWKLDTSAERPFSVQYRHLGSTKFSKLYNLVFEYTRTVIHRFKDGLTFNYDPITLHVKPALVFQWAEDKVRTVWGIPKYLIFSEAMFFWPLFSHYHTERQTPLLWNYESLNGGWYRLTHEWFKHKGIYFNLDWSEFDMRVYFSMWLDIINEVSTFFCFCGKYCPTRTYPSPRTSPQRITSLWNRITDMYFNMPCVTPMGNVFKRLYAGMPSGIFCTQFYDSVYNGVMIVTCLLSLGVPIPEDFPIKLMGDDVLFVLLMDLPFEHWPEFLEALASEALWRFGSKLNPDKAHVSPSIQGAFVLGYSNNNGLPTRDPAELLAKLLHPKSLRDTPGNLMARSIGIYYASAGDRRFRPICLHIYDHFARLGFKPSIKGLASLFDPTGLRLTEEDLQRFPTQTEVLARIAKPSARNPELQAKYWPREHFLSEAGFVQC